MGIHDNLIMNEMGQNPIEKFPSDSSLPKRSHRNDPWVAIRESLNSTTQRDDIGGRPAQIVLEYAIMIRVEEIPREYRVNERRHCRNPKRWSNIASSRKAASA